MNSHTALLLLLVRGGYGSMESRHIVVRSGASVRADIILWGVAVPPRPGALPRHGRQNDWRRVLRISDRYRTARDGVCPEARKSLIIGGELRGGSGRQSHCGHSLQVLSTKSVPVTPRRDAAADRLPSVGLSPL